MSGISHADDKKNEKKQQMNSDRYCTVDNSYIDLNDNPYT